ncbi:pyridoxamine 5'-phosphate oxidase family protein [Paraburkholderia sediminicola]|uniref:pyridoxamine 5'-phosphate oxidase family protein n=1 Tax=Paraburkholderia sediminicola TaxID=458836 RepID=UPI0038B91973
MSGADKADVPSKRAPKDHDVRHTPEDLALIHSILDATPLCSVGYVSDGRPFVIPCMQWRVGDSVYWHGSSTSRVLASPRRDVCLSISLTDGLVMSRSSFNYRLNHRSVTIIGKPKEVSDIDDKVALLRSFINGLIPGQWDRLKPLSLLQMRATKVVTIPIRDAIVEIRTGQPDDDEDRDFPAWGGVVPISTQVGVPIEDPSNRPGIEMPEDVLRFRLG